MALLYLQQHDLLAVVMQEGVFVKKTYFLLWTMQELKLKNEIFKS